MQTKESRRESIDALENNSVRRGAVSGNILFTTDHGGQSVTVPGVLLASFPDKFRLEIQDPVGGMLAIVVVNGERFWLYEQARAEILTGPLASIPFPLLPKGRAEDLVRIFLARPFMNRVRQGEIEGGQSVFRSPPFRETVAWESNGEPTLWRRENGGTLQFSAEYEDYEFRSGLRFPTKLSLNGQGGDRKQRQVRLVWKDWEPSVPGDQKLFQIPQVQNFGRKIKVLR